LASPDAASLDLKRTLSKNRLLGLWRMMTGFRRFYVAASLCMAVAAISRTGTFLLLRTLVDDVLDKARFQLLPHVALGFVGLAALERSFTRQSAIIAHRIQRLMSADLILVVDKGRIVQQGAHEELIVQPGIYRQIYEIQTRIETELEREIARVGV
jgi:ABC-type multidrug transport system fused ATPase/permease subunit